MIQPVTLRRSTARQSESAARPQQKQLFFNNGDAMNDVTIIRFQGGREVDRISGALDTAQIVQWAEAG